MQSTKTCSFDGCDLPHKTRGLCNGHYQQNRKGNALSPLRPKLTLEQRFWQKVTKTPDCWVWTAGTDRHGYGKINVDGRHRIAHRVAWEMAKGTIPDGLDIDHRCGNRACVNPEHLRVTTRSQNQQHRRGATRNSNSGIRGVNWHKQHGAWRAQAKLNGRQYYGGYHSSIEAADKAARALRAKLHTHDDHHEWLKKQKDTE